MACLEESNPGEPPVRMEDADCPVAGGGDEAAVAAVDARHPSADAYIVYNHARNFYGIAGVYILSKNNCPGGGGGGMTLC